ncbi:MAG: DUF2116 family Zn-ribbon domain-containing protein [Candidatus Thermoplasmatota archaeon]
MVKVDQHSHCKICGKAIPTEETFCSKDCEEQYQNMYKKRKMLIYVMYGLIVFILAVFGVSLLGGG